MAFHFDKFGHGTVFSDWFKVMYHGLQLDLSMAGYLTILTALFIVSSVWLKPQLVKKMIYIYSIFLVVIITIIFSVDLDLYTYWNFRLDATPLAFLKTPQSAAASFTIGLVSRQLLIMVAYFCFLFFSYKKIFKNDILKFTPVKWWSSPIFLLIGGLLFFPIRGGLTAATMNVGWVYFSENMFLNHSAINPFWNFMASVTEHQDFGKQYRLMDDKKAQAIFETMRYKKNNPDQLQVIKTSRPNVIIVVMESFSAKLIAPLGGLPDVTPNLDKLSEEGILFTNFYATGSRTDRGVSAVMSGYPSQPKTCIMNYPEKTNNLANIGKTLRKANYDLSFYYGGDEKFANMRSYLVNAGFEKITSDKNFSKKEYASSWGAADAVVFKKMINDLKKRDKKAPFFNLLLTLSSHEPFTVPMPKKFKGNCTNALYKNAVYYSDSCIGEFIREAKKEDWWSNTVIIFVSDHSFPFPEGIPIHIPDRYHIPMIWLGGAIEKPMKIDEIGFQPDIAATLLGQLHLDSSDFTFSKNILDKKSPKFAFYTYNSGFGLIEKNAVGVMDLNTNKPSVENSNPATCEKGKAYFQYMFDDLGKR
jgi:phosphoglycerol transferase MdoB-like AlkP superfamily enzyme